MNIEKKPFLIYINVTCSLSILQWQIDSSPPKSSVSDVTIGLLLNTDHAEDVLDMGPPADDPEVIIQNYFEY